LPGAGAPLGAVASAGQKRERERDAREDKIERERERKNREGREIEFPKDLCANLENCRDLSVKHKFLINLEL
jgi:hypothetical protein